MAEDRSPERTVESRRQRFGKSKKRLPAKAHLLVDDAVRALLADPLSGEPKVGRTQGRAGGEV